MREVKGKTKGMKIVISPSGRADKKWKAQKEDGGPSVHFGQKDATDFTRGATAAQRENYIKRHSRGENWGPTGVLTPGWLSRHILWEKKGMRAAVRAASNMYDNVKFKLA